MKVAYSQRNISNVASTPTNFEQAPVEPEKKRVYVKKIYIFQVPPDTRMNNTVNENCSQHKKNP